MRSLKSLIQSLAFLLGLAIVSIALAYCVAELIVGGSL
jgi:hypothetical protein